MNETVIKIQNLKKQYRLGVIGGGTLSSDLQSFWARKCGKEDPNTKIGEKDHKQGETFMALNGINFEVKRGEALGIIGANGAGKSTLLKLLSRVTAPTEGDIWYNGRISSMLEVGTGFHGELTGRENIYMNGAILGMSKREVASKIEDIIEFSECRKFIDTPVKRYSSGMYVKLAFAVAAYLDAEIMVMDEVLAVGDLKFQEKCLGKMGSAANSKNKTILYVSHNMATVRNLCSRTIVLKDGLIVFDGKTDEAIQHYMDNYSVSEMVVNFSDLPRTSQEISTIKMVEFSLIRKQESSFTVGEKMHFSMAVESEIDECNLGIRMTLYYIDNTPASMLSTSNEISISRGERKTIDICADISMLAPGKYFVDFILWKPNNKAAHLRYDAVKGKVSFVIKAYEGFNNNFEWGHSVYGHVVLPNLLIE